MLNGFISACREDSDVVSIWEGLTAEMNNEEKETTSIILWSTWNFRNKATMGVTTPNVQALIRQIKRQRSEQSKYKSLKEGKLTTESQENHEVWSPHEWGL